MYGLGENLMTGRGGGMISEHSAGSILSPPRVTTTSPTPLPQVLGIDLHGLRVARDDLQAINATRKTVLPSFHPAIIISISTRFYPQDRLVTFRGRSEREDGRGSGRCVTAAFRSSPWPCSGSHGCPAGLMPRAKSSPRVCKLTM